MIDTPGNIRSRCPERLEIRVAGRTWLIEREGDLEDLWRSLDGLDEDERLPYWVELWPASLLLAQWLEAHPEALNGRTVADLGCGLGLISMIAARLGARMLGLDYILQAATYARNNALLNAAQNDQALPHFVVMDWRVPALKAGVLDLVLAADVFYELRFIEPVLDFLEYTLAPGGRAILADPQRSTWPHFLHRAKARGFRYALLQHKNVTAATTPHTTCSVGIYELTPPGPNTTR